MAAVGHESPSAIFSAFHPGKTQLHHGRFKRNLFVPDLQVCTGLRAIRFHMPQSDAAASMEKRRRTSRFNRFSPTQDLIAVTGKRRKRPGKPTYSRPGLPSVGGKGSFPLKSGEINERSALPQGGGGLTRCCRRGCTLLSGAGPRPDPGRRDAAVLSGAARDRRPGHLHVYLLTEFAGIAVTADNRLAPRIVMRLNPKKGLSFTSSPANSARTSR